MFNFKPLDNANLPWLEDELQRYVKRLVAPRRLFFMMVRLLHDRNIALPSYHLLSGLISKNYINYEKQLLEVIEQNLTSEQQQGLNNLLKTNKQRDQGLLNQFKNINQSLKPKAIQASVDIFQQVAELFIQPCITSYKSIVLNARKL